MNFNVLSFVLFKKKFCISFIHEFATTNKQTIQPSPPYGNIFPQHVSEFSPTNIVFFSLFRATYGIFVTVRNDVEVTTFSGCPLDNLLE